MSQDSLLMVSIRCLVYNHEHFLRQCLDGFVMQKTSFRFEAIVHDDASTDASAAIILEYADKYPDIIKPIIEKENQWSKGDNSLNRILDAACNGKYTAFCEGDDYWTDPQKLQRQVDFLEAHPDFSFCVHDTKVYNQKTRELLYKKQEVLNDHPEGYVIKMNYGKWVTRPLSLMWRTDILKEKDYTQCRSKLDIVMAYFLLRKGNGYLLPDVMGVYRVHDGGISNGIPYVQFHRMVFEGHKAIIEVDPCYDSYKYLLDNLKNTMWYNLHSANFAYIKELEIYVWKNYNISSFINLQLSTLGHLFVCYKNIIIYQATKIKRYLNSFNV